MYESYNNLIKITRGDSAVFHLNILQKNNTPYIIKEEDTVLFTVKKNTKIKDYLIQKNVVNGNIVLTPQDTSNLEYGEYFYDVQLKTADGLVDTVIPPNKFKVLEEVTF